MSAILKAHAVSMAIGSARLVDGVGLDIAGGEMVAIVGPNGAGKSTLLRMLSGDLRPTGGSIELVKRSIGSYSPRELALRRAMLSQHVHVTFPFTVEEIVEMGTGGRSRAASRPLVERRSRAADLSWQAVCRQRLARPPSAPAAARISMDFHRRRLFPDRCRHGRRAGIGVGALKAGRIGTLLP